MVRTISVSGIDANSFAKYALQRGIEGQVWDVIGFTKDWGTEDSIRFETSAKLLDLHTFVVNFLRDHGEEAAYIHPEGREAYLLFASGNTARITS